MIVVCAPPQGAKLLQVLALKLERILTIPLSRDLRVGPTCFRRADRRALALAPRSQVSWTLLGRVR